MLPFGLPSNRAAIGTPNADAILPSVWSEGDSRPDSICDTMLGVRPAFTFSGGQADSRIPFLHRRLADGDSYFLVNQLDRTETIEARFRVTGKAPELWNAETGKAQPVSYRIEGGETIVPLTLQADDSVHVVFRKPATAPVILPITFRLEFL